jgi:hypothetical protein
MKTNQMFFLAVLVLAGTVCLGQEKDNNTQFAVVDYKPGPTAALLVLDVGNRKLVPAKGEEVSVESFNTRWLQSISVLKGKDATDLCGDKGKNGVIVLVFKDYDLVPQALQSKFTEMK